MVVYQVDIGDVRNAISVPFRYSEVTVGWFGAVMWSIIKMSHSPIGGASESACLVGYVDEEVCCSVTFIG